jgi:tryprostatin B 6-hydroxylase
MGTMMTASVAGEVGVFLGLFTWALYWNRGEHHLWTVQYVQLAFLFPILGAIGGSILLGISRTEALRLCLAAEGAYVTAVWANMLVYRAFFHRLHRFPGPFTWKLSKLVQAYRNRNFENYKIVDELHKQYGEYVRTGKL